MRDPEIEGRLQSMMSARAGQVGEEQVAVRLPVARLQNQARPARPRLAGALAAAAAVIVIAGGAVAVQATGDHRPTTTAPAASATPGSVTYVRSSDGGGAVWIPADRSGRWQLSRPDLPDASRTERADCAAFPFFHDGTTGVDSRSGRPPLARSGGVPDCEQGSWSIYRPAFAAGLPTDPTAMLAAMRRSGLGSSDADTFVTGLDFIASGWVEPRVVAAIVDALKLVPGVTVTHDVGNGAGATGDALTYAGRVKPTVLEHWTVIVDPNTDRVIGTGHSYPGGSDHNTITYRTVNALGDTR